MIKALSLLIATTALAGTAFGSNDLFIKEHKVNNCKKSSQSQGDYIIKECGDELSFKNRMVISGVSYKMSKTKTENRLDLLILDKRGANYYMANGVSNSTFEPNGKIEIVKTGLTDKAVIYRLDYSAFDSDESFFRIVTVRLRSNLINPRETCVVSVSDSKDQNLKLEKKNKKAVQVLEKDFRSQAQDFVTSVDFAKADCVVIEHSH